MAREDASDQRTMFSMLEVIIRSRCPSCRHNQRVRRYFACLRAGLNSLLGGDSMRVMCVHVHLLLSSLSRTRSIRSMPRRQNRRGKAEKRAYIDVLARCACCGCGAGCAGGGLLRHGGTPALLAGAGVVGRVRVVARKHCVTECELQDAGRVSGKSRG